jgi:hypothetical protein
MTEHKFAAGDRVSLLSNNANANVRLGVYTIVRCMPAIGIGFQYRAKSALDNHERVVDEVNLRRA